VSVPISERRSQPRPSGRRLARSGLVKSPVVQTTCLSPDLGVAAGLDRPTGAWANNVSVPISERRSRPRPSGRRLARSGRVKSPVVQTTCLSPDLGVAAGLDRPDRCLVRSSGTLRFGDRHGVTATPVTGLFMTLLWRRYRQRQCFFSGIEPGGSCGDGVAADISQPGGAELSDQRANAPRL
jgi:hypothetical protein